MDKKTVFISYSHDSAEHLDRVLGLSQRLRADGIETRLDQYVNGSPQQGWPRWMLDQLDAADFALVVCTETYYRRFRGQEEPGKGKGVDWEGALITQELYDSRSRTLKFVPVFLSTAVEDWIPEPLRSVSYYALTSEDAYKRLYDFLLDQAGVEPGALGPMRARARREGVMLTFGESAPSGVAGEPRPPREIRDGIVNQVAQGGSQQAIKHLVIIVPGIRDRGGDWNVVRGELEAAGFVATIAGWSEYFSLPRFLVPAPWFRRIAMRALHRRIMDAIQTFTVDGQQPRVSYVAHSFGSYILCYLLRREYFLKTHRLILCGSVLARQFKFSSFEERFEGSVINEVGKDDDWPFRASCVTFGYGTIGTYGYAGEPVRDRYHDNIDHSGFAKPGFCSRWWVPYLSTTGRDGIHVPENNQPAREETFRKSWRVLLQKLKWLVAGGLIWLVIAWPLNRYCAGELTNFSSLTKIEWMGQSTRLIELGRSLELADDRAQREHHHICRRMPAIWPITTQWPAQQPVTLHDNREIAQLKSCGPKSEQYELQQSLNRPSGAQVLDVLAKQFHTCLWTTRDARGELSEIWLRGSGGAGSLQSGVKRLAFEEPKQIGSETQSTIWYLCDCTDGDVLEFKRFRGAR